MVRIIQADELRPLLRIDRLVDPMKQAMQDASSGRATSAITVLHPTTQSDMHVKSATLEGAPVFTVKMAGWSQSRAKRGASPTTGMIAVYDSKTCELLALLNDEHLISDYRTAAAGAVVADSLARKDASVLAVVGTGLQARLQAEAVCLVRKITRIVVWGRSATKAKRLASSLRESLAVACVDVVVDLSEAVAGADIIVCATAAQEPLVSGDWLRPGQHITSVGADDGKKAELAASCFDCADLVVVDSIEAARTYGNLARIVASGCAIPAEKVEEIGVLLQAGRPIRVSNSQITCASLVGLGVQDLATVIAIGDQLW